MGVFGRRSNSSLWNAGLFLLVFGLPALRYLLSGRSESVDDWFDYRLEHHPEFLRRIAEARAALREGRGTPLRELR
jgi:hypothetical protein